MDLRNRLCHVKFLRHRLLGLYSGRVESSIGATKVMTSKEILASNLNSIFIFSKRSCPRAWFLRADLVSQRSGKLEEHGEINVKLEILVKEISSKSKLETGLQTDSPEQGFVSIYHKTVYNCHIKTYDAGRNATEA